jgi:hypothetical protein
MEAKSYFYNCSPEYINGLDPALHNEILEIVPKLPKRRNQSEINGDLFWFLTAKGWSYDSIVSGIGVNPPKDLDIKADLIVIKKRNLRDQCLTSTTLNTRWHADFAKMSGMGLIQVEAQFGKVEAMFKDFCGFRIAYAEKRLALGIMIVLCDPNSYFSHRKSAISGMANFDIAKNTLTAIGLDVPIWLVGICTTK